MSDYTPSLFISLPLAGLLLLSSCSKHEPALTADSEVLARVNGIAITDDDLHQEAARYRAEGRPVPDEKGLLDQLINFQAQVQRARAEGLDEDPAVKRQLEKVLVQSLRNREQQGAGATVNENELRTYYNAHRDQYTKPAADRLAILFLAVEKNSSNATRQNVQQRMEKARQAALLQDQSNPAVLGFGSLAQTFSDDQLSRYRGGDIGWSFRTQRSPRIPETVWQRGVSLDKGAVSEVLITDAGFYLVKKIDTRPAVTAPFEQVRVSIERSLRSGLRQAREEEYIQACRNAAHVELNQARIEKLKNPVSGAVSKPEQEPSQRAIPQP